MAPDGDGGCEMRLEQIPEADKCERGYNYGVFLAVEDDRLIAPGRGGIGFTHQPGFQTTRFPCKMTWQGSWEELTQAIEQGTFSGLDDTANHLDRLFLIRVRGEDRSTWRDHPLTCSRSMSSLVASGTR